MTTTPSLFRRGIVVLGVVYGVTAAVLTMASWAYARRAANDAYDRLLVGATLQLAEGVFVQNGIVGVDAPASAFETLALAPDDRIFYRIADPDGTVLTGYDDLLPPGGFRSIARSEPVVGDGTYLGVPIRLALVGRFLTDASAPGWAQVLVGQTRNARVALANDLTAKAMGLLAVMTVVAFLVVLAAVRFSLSPLQSIERTLKTRSNKDLSPLSVDTPREIKTLIEAINFFMGRLAHRIQIVERFIAIAAHQIRTPITALASQVDLLSVAGPGERAMYLRRVQERTVELGRLTNQLLDHAMVIHRAEIVLFHPVDLSELSRQALLHAVPLADDRGITVELDVPAHPVVIEGDFLSLREALANLLHNAVDHGARTRIGIELSVEPPFALVCVVDDGSGIPQADWEAVKRPFSTGGGPGSGLGLAIVDEVVRAHSGSLDFLWGDRGFAAVLRLPLRDPAGDQVTRS